MKFKELDLNWKILVVAGAVSFFLLIFTIIIVVLIFETDLFKIANDPVDISEFDFIFN